MIKSSFHIKDLEQLTGVKAHTIRIWEKRYGLLEPNRTDTNIRKYDIRALQKLLNVVHLVNAGFKVSKVAKLSDDEVNELIKNTSSKEGFEKEKNTLKMSMLNFDVQLFDQAYNGLCNELSFSEVFQDVLVPFLKEVGLDWQIDSVTPANEHFISNLIRQKLYLNIEKTHAEINRMTDKAYVLFLPQGEMHDIGLLYLYYELLKRGKNAIFLGNEVPIQSLLDFKNLYNNVEFISFFTVTPPEEKVLNYLNEISSTVLRESKDTIHVFGIKVQSTKVPNNMMGVYVYKDIAQYIDK